MNRPLGHTPASSPLEALARILSRALAERLTLPDIDGAEMDLLVQPRRSRPGPRNRPKSGLRPGPRAALDLAPGGVLNSPERPGTPSGPLPGEAP